ncbi:DUF3329 domain-containing protein [Pseudomonas gessardii]|uniref:Uncharacterized protein n=1 Tax=Pseudomonas gessardii TaxID=78544 RepID=A0A7Y1MWY1_9PSED|nr:DUF6056 family protein [Pseudomonas gessardii]NNA99532.1 hypothetical protein [Pseudomonas gessardii]
MIRKIGFYFSLVMVFVAILVPSLQVPMQSDDFAYYTLGTSFDAQIVHYLGWSGRLVTNTISSYLLNLLPHFAYEIVNSIVFLLLVLFICLMPRPFQSIDATSSSIPLLIIFTLYWIANPALGETSFWIVGSTNYLWTSMFVAAYFIYIFHSINYKVGVRQAFFGLVMGFLAGCSNENTSVVVALITVFIIVVEKGKKIPIYGLIGNVVGAAVLILSPGNKIRADIFWEWKSLSLYDKFDLHFYERLPSAMSGYWQVYLVLIISLFAICWISNPSKKQLLYSVVFFIGAILANMAFVASPYVPPRAYNGSLVMLLMSLSFAMSSIIYSDFKALKAFYVGSIFLFISIYFVPSYILFNSAVGHVWGQSKIRESIIFDAKSKGLKEIQVPSYHYTRLLKSSDTLSTFDNSAVNLYYGVDKISYVPAQFNYAGIERLPKIDVDLVVKEGIRISSIYAYDEGMGYNSKLIFKVSGDINSTFRGGASMYIHIFMKDGAYLNRDTAVDALDINGASFASAELGVDYHKIDRIELGMYTATEMLSGFVIKNPEFDRADK